MRGCAVLVGDACRAAAVMSYLRRKLLCPIGVHRPKLVYLDSNESRKSGAVPDGPPLDLYVSGVGLPWMNESKLIEAARRDGASLAGMAGLKCRDCGTGTALDRQAARELKAEIRDWETKRRLGGGWQPRPSGDKQLPEAHPVDQVRWLRERAAGHAPGFDIHVYARPDVWNELADTIERLQLFAEAIALGDPLALSDPRGFAAKALWGDLRATAETNEAPIISVTPTK